MIKKIHTNLNNGLHLGDKVEGVLYCHFRHIQCTWWNEPTFSKDTDTGMQHKTQHSHAASACWRSSRLLKKLKAASAVEHCLHSRYNINTVLFLKCLLQLPYLVSYGHQTSFIFTLWIILHYNVYSSSIAEETLVFMGGKLRKPGAESETGFHELQLLQLIIQILHVLHMCVA